MAALWGVAVSYERGTPVHDTALVGVGHGGRVGSNDGLSFSYHYMCTGCEQVHMRLTPLHLDTRTCE